LPICRGRRVETARTTVPIEASEPPRSIVKFLSASTSYFEEGDRVVAAGRHVSRAHWWRAQAPIKELALLSEVRDDWAGHAVS
jgi:hypothetical protein